jgi:hypothetical protein
VSQLRPVLVLVRVMFCSQGHKGQPVAFLQQGMRWRVNAPALRASL